MDLRAILTRPLSGSSCTTTATAAASKTFTLADLGKAFEALKQLPRDPLAEAMTSDGFNPDNGGILVLPDTAELRALPWGPFGPPSYVRFSPLVTAPTYARDPLHHFPYSLHF